MNILYERLLGLCDKNGITGYRMCKDVGIQPSIMTDLKNGRKKGLSAGIASRLAAYFGVSVGYLLGQEDATGTESPSALSISPDAAVVQDILRELNSEGQWELLRYARYLLTVPDYKKCSESGNVSKEA